MSESWLPRAACRHFPDLFSTTVNQKGAVHICRYHCPVARQCHAAYGAGHNTDIVVGGYAYGHKGERLEKLHGDGHLVLHNPWCRALPAERLKEA